MNKKYQSGLASRTLIVLAFVALLAIIAVYFTLKYVEDRRSDQVANSRGQKSQEPPPPEYETQIGDIKFKFESASDLGNVMHAPRPGFPDITTTERFVRVVISAQNKGKNDTASFAWDVGNIIDSQGRNFIAITNKAYYFLPSPDLCGAILHPEFTPTSCVRIYEVSKVSTSLGISVNALSGADSSKKQEAFLDLNVTD